MDVDAATVSGALDSAFASFPKLRSYVVDDQGQIRRHVAVFLDGQMLDRATALDAAVGPGSEIHILQALSGG